MGDFELAKDKVLMGAERKSMVISNEEQRVTALSRSRTYISWLESPQR